MFTCILGKSASGKSTILNRLIDHGYKKIITYTTRPIRKGEVQDREYHFISNDEFKEKIDSGFFAEWKSYNTLNGTWYYGSAKEDYINADSKTIIILTPSGYKDIVKILNITPKSIYIYANSKTIKNRLYLRGDDNNEIVRRMKTDNEDFKGIEIFVDKIVYNNDSDDIQKIVKTIIKYMENIW